MNTPLFHQGDWLTPTEKFSALSAQLFDNPFRLDHEPYQVDGEWRVKLRIKLNGSAMRDKEFPLDCFKKTVNPAFSSAESRLKQEMAAPAPTSASDADTAAIALIQKQFDELRKLIVEFIEDDDAKKEIAENVAAILRLTQLRERDIMKLEERVEKLESEVQDILRQKKIVAFQSQVSEKTQ